MSKYQQEVAVLLIASAILYAGFKTTLIGVACLIGYLAFVWSMFKGASHE
ncbi:hypothetical protein ACJBLD_19560 [Acinetobacter nosocomialis]|nr:MULTISPECIES: hypothetical protein [Acinetobacter calcoaceticus/baumannii complex]MBD8351724.1 hypothetical protein [Acinetobacter nosocomialis]MBZ6531442.1 hypothetical protein [Acinetobacter nosocomialis]MCZ2994788.1 hypothetical protein [Acinetobacter baumannii]MDA3498420.1 hypothetical protein [Acinetobacter baumannii]MDV4231043.1 hypothetical protein [Acinetobacter baumannii]